MERDFLGMNGKDSGSVVKDDGRGSRHDSSSFLGGPVVQRPFANKISALQQFMTYKTGQDERSKRIVVDQLSSSGFQPIATGASQLQPSQKGSSLSQQAVHQFPVHNYQTQITSPSASAHNLSEAKSSSVAVHHPMPVATSNSFFKVHGSPNNINLTVANLKQQFFSGGLASNAPAAGSTAAAFAPRNIPRPSVTTAQLTIFYAGSLNVYDSVPLDKAQEIMYLASKMANASLNSVNPRPEAPAPAFTEVARGDGLIMNQMQSQTQIQTQNHVASPCSGLSSPVSTSSNPGAQLGSGCSTTNEIVGALAANSKNVGPFGPTSQPEPSKTTTTTMGSSAPVSIMPRAIPQARKASLARFLEKRKERVTSTAPYATAKKTPENAPEFNGSSSNSSSADIALSRNMEDAWSFGCRNKNIIDCEESPSTKLEM